MMLVKTTQHYKNIRHLLLGTRKGTGGKVVGEAVVRKNYKCFFPSTMLPKGSAFPVSIRLDVTGLILGGRARRVQKGISKSLAAFPVHDYLPLILYWADLCGKDVGGVFILQSTKARGSSLHCLLVGQALLRRSAAGLAGAHTRKVEGSSLASLREEDTQISPGRLQKHRGYVSCNNIKRVEQKRRQHSGGCRL